MTNGEKILTILDVDRDCTEVHGEHGMLTFTVTHDWWNAEYKEPVIRDNGIKDELNRVKDELEPTTKSETLISLGVYKQVAWERDIAIQQLHELGYEFGQKIEPTTKNNLSSELEKNSKKLEKNIGELDCISRIETIDYLCKHCPDDGECFKDCDEIQHLRQMPPVTPIRPKGHWINKYHSFESCSAECSSCHKCSDGYMHDNGFSLECKYYDFCPNCGSDNREVEE